MSVSGDERFLRQSLALAALAETTSPNPRVGCVVVREGTVVGVGYHRAAGTAHAEAIAVDRAGDRARGATLYVNLEPCAHHGRTPPCVDKILRAGVRRVVAAMVDPDDRVNGRGFSLLRKHGVEVEVGRCARTAEELNAPFLHWHRTRRPLVTLKAAASLDGMLSAAEGNSRWITGPAARRFGHRLRASHDAILVGAETVRRDDPKLTVRLPGVSSTPTRVVLCPELNLDPGCRMLAEGGGPVLVYGDCSRNRRAEGPPHSPVEIVRVRRAAGEGLNLEEILLDLGARGVQALLVEGGGRTHASFLSAGFVDRAALFLSSRLLGARGGTPLVDQVTVASPAHGWRLRAPRRVALGEDLLLWGPVETLANRKGV